MQSLLATMPCQVAWHLWPGRLYGLLRVALQASTFATLLQLTW